MGIKPSGKLTQRQASAEKKTPVKVKQFLEIYLEKMQSPAEAAMAIGYPAFSSTRDGKRFINDDDVVDLVAAKSLDRNQVLYFLSQIVRDGLTDKAGNAVAAGLKDRLEAVKIIIQMQSMSLPPAPTQSVNLNINAMISDDEARKILAELPSNKVSDLPVETINTTAKTPKP